MDVIIPIMGGRDLSEVHNANFRAFQNKSNFRFQGEDQALKTGKVRILKFARILFFLSISVTIHPRGCWEQRAFVSCTTRVIYIYTLVIWILTAIKAKKDTKNFYFKWLFNVIRVIIYQNFKMLEFLNFPILFFYFAHKIPFD